MGINVGRYNSDPEYKARICAQRNASRERNLETARNWLKNNPGKVAEYQRLCRYGVSKGQFAQLLANQEGKCALCSRDIMGPKQAHVDHCHETGVVRGLLCSNCNRGLGLLGDDPDLLDRAARYLRRMNHGGSHGD